MFYTDQEKIKHSKGKIEPDKSLKVQTNTQHSWTAQFETQKAAVVEETKPEVVVEVKPEMQVVEAALVEEVQVEDPKQPEAKVEEVEEEKPAVEISMNSLKQPDPPAES